MNFINKWFKNYQAFDYLCFGLIIFYTIVACVVSIHRFWQFDAFHYDLGIYDAAIWKVSRFKAPIIDHLVMGGKWNFADHFTPIIFLFSPLYWLTSKTEMLLIGQAVCVGLGLFFAYLSVRETIKNSLMILALLFAFMGYVGMQNAIIANFHPITVAIFPLMVCFWAILKRRWRVYWIFLLILLGLQEDMSIIGVSLGVYLFLKDKKTKLIGKITFILSLIYSLSVITIIIPHFSGGIYNYSINFNRPFLNWISDFFWPFEKIKTLLVSFATFGFLPFLHWQTLLIIFPSFYARFVLSGGRDGLGLHYNALVAPLMFIASVEVLRYMEKKWPNKVVNFYSLLIIVIVLLFHQFIFPGALGLFFRHEFYANTQRNKFLNDLINKVPKNGSLMSQNHLTPRFIHDHDQVYLIREKYWQYNPKYIVIELRDGQNPNNFWPMNESAIREMVRNIKKDPNYQLIYKFNEEYIFKKI